MKIAHLYIVSVPDTSTLVTAVAAAVSVVVVVGKNILGAVAAAGVAEAQEVAVAVLTSSGKPGLTMVAEAVVMSLGHEGSTRTENETH